MDRQPADALASPESAVSPAVASHMADPKTEIPRPIPPRYRWLKRLAVIWLLLALALAGAWWAWDAAADRRIKAIVTAAQARGEPVLFDDFLPKTIPALENAAVPLSKAVGRVTFSQKETASAGQFSAALPLSASDQATLASLLPAHSAELQQVRLARGMPRLDWGHRFSRPVFNTLLPWAHKERELGILLRWSACYQHAIGNDAEAIEDLRDLEMLAEAADREPPCMVTHLIALGIHGLSAETTLRLAPGLQPDADDRVSVRALIRQLLDDGPVDEGMRRACYGQRMMLLDDPASLKLMMGAGPPGYYFPTPLVKLHAARSAEELSRIADAVAQPVWAKAKASLPPRELPGSKSLIQEFTEADLPATRLAPDRPLLQHYRVLALRHLAATALAIRLYASEHDGQFPASLQELVPNYLPAVPADPFRADGGAPGYRPNSKPPIIYSVGYNGTDEGGSTKYIGPPGGAAKTDEWDQEDVVFPLLPPESAKK